MWRLSPLRWRALQLIVDSTGLKLNGPGEWLVEKHGTTKRRSWHKLHIGLDAVSGEIVASTLTGRDIDDDSQVPRCSIRWMALLACSWVMALMIAPMFMRLSRNDIRMPL